MRERGGSEILAIVWWRGNGNETIITVLFLNQLYLNVIYIDKCLPTHTHSDKKSPLKEKILFYLKIKQTAKNFTYRISQNNFVSFHCCTQAFTKSSNPYSLTLAHVLPRCLNLEIYFSSTPCAAKARKYN